MIFTAALLPPWAGAAGAGGMTVPTEPALPAEWRRTCYKTWLRPPANFHNSHRMQPLMTPPLKGECYEAMERTSRVSF